MLMTTHPDNTISAAILTGRNKPKYHLNMVLAILLIVTILSLLGGGYEIHGVSGIFMLIGCSIHLVQHRHWIKAVILEKPKNITPTLRRQYRLFGGLFFSGFLCGLSGLGALPLIVAPHIFLPLHFCGNLIHVVSGLAFISLNITHLVLHRNWFKRIFAFSSLTSR
jgi:hypothetical protein